MRHSLLIVPLLLAGCLGARYVRTGDVTVAARPAGCEFSLYTVAPPAGAVELGVVEYQATISTFENARLMAAPHVCAAGGDGLVIWTSSKDGTISRATIIKRS